MKRVGYITDKDGRRITLLEAMGDYGNVQKAYNKARKCKRHRKDVLIFTKDKEENLDKVREDILNLAYEPSEYHYFKVYEPKERQIMALPFYDRVVQHAINNVLEPIFDKRFISQSYACRKGKGMHAASDTLKEWLYEWNKYHPDQPLYGIMRAARKKGMGKGAGVSGEVYGRTAGHRRTGRGQHHRQRRGTQDTGKIRIIRT